MLGKTNKQTGMLVEWQEEQYSLVQQIKKRMEIRPGKGQEPDHLGPCNQEQKF